MTTVGDLGGPLDDSLEHVYVPRFDPGRGMSAGQVMPRWWRSTGIPILIDRFRAISGGR